MLRLALFVLANAQSLLAISVSAPVIPDFCDLYRIPKYDVNQTAKTSPSSGLPYGPSQIGWVSDHLDEIVNASVRWQQDNRPTYQLASVNISNVAAQGLDPSAKCKGASVYVGFVRLGPELDNSKADKGANLTTWTYDGQTGTTSQYDTTVNTTGTLPFNWTSKALDLVALNNARVNFNISGSNTRFGFMRAYGLNGSDSEASNKPIAFIEGTLTRNNETLSAAAFDVSQAPRVRFIATYSWD